MDKDFFANQIQRLRSQWANAYGPERQARLWFSFNRLDNEKFRLMVDRAIDKCRAAPLGKEFLLFEEEISREEKEARWFSGVTQAGFGLEAYAKANRVADPDFVKTCVRLVQDKTTGKITPEQFLQGCDLLDEASKNIWSGY